MQNFFYLPFLKTTLGSLRKLFYTLSVGCIQMVDRTFCSWMNLQISFFCVRGKSSGKQQAPQVTNEWFPKIFFDIPESIFNRSFVRSCCNNKTQQKIKEHNVKTLDIETPTISICGKNFFETVFEETFLLLKRSQTGRLGFWGSNLLLRWGIKSQSF